ncbi:MAG: ATP-binding protein [Flavipsychrobacter sp.]|nr:ATP-binding protein [Flavipsychrobacter sp.]
MKLFARYNRLNIMATVIVFMVGGFTFYLLLHYILVQQVDSTLQSEQQEIYQYVKIHGVLPEILNTKDQHEVFSKGVPVQQGYATVNYQGDGRDELYRDVRFNIAVEGEKYGVIVSKPLRSTQLLLNLIILVTLAMIALILVTGLLINRRILNNIWRPFYDTVGQVKQYNLSAPDAVTLQKTDIEEFALLNDSIAAMMDSVQQDYQALKKFTGHAAHEMQTPLAVIRTRMDMLMQQENLLNEYGPGIAEIEQAVQRLSRLNQSLLLLTKVENRQFALNEEVQIEEVVENKCAEFTEMMLERKISLSLSVTPFSVRFHRQLAEILTGNLVNNAMRYNKQGGAIVITLDNGLLTIANTSNLPALEQEQVFQRFYRHSDVKAEGNGLGLSIVKQICDFAGFTVNYTYVNDMHIFCVNFNASTTIGG